ncbi:MAG: hypothetical protein FJ225_02410 [Lentisphaerae bacterium]|nr:hypothetical protein [Lentisphaerota bacterium]
MNQTETRRPLASLALATFWLAVTAAWAEPGTPATRSPAVYVSDRNAEDPEYNLSGGKKSMLESSTAQFKQDETLTPERLLRQVGQEQPATFTNVNPPYERIDGMKPENNRYNASIGPLMGMGRPATVLALDVSVALDARR